MVGVDIAFGVNTPKLDIPLKFQPTNAEERGWVIPPLGKNPVWTIPAAAIPALLATILVFMDQQITALIVNRREHKLKVCLIQYGAFILLVHFLCMLAKMIHVSHISLFLVLGRVSSIRVLRFGDGVAGWGCMPMCLDPTQINTQGRAV